MGSLFVRLRVKLAVLCIVVAATGAAAGGQELNLHCRLYLAVEQEAELSDFPVLITSARRGRVEVVVPSLAWLESQPGGIARNFGALDDKEKTLRRFLRSQPGVVSVGVERDGMLEFADVDERKQEALEKLCPARLDIRTEPGGGTLFVDGQPKGELPAEIEVASGERRLAFELEGHRTHRETVLLQPGESREIAIAFEPLAALDLTTALPGAAVIVDGHYVAMTPAVAWVEDGPHDLRLLAPGFWPYELSVETELGATYPIAVELAPRDEPACYSWGLDGTVKQRLKELRKALVGEELHLALPLPKVLSSVMENELPTTHIVDGTRILFEARMGNDYVDHPSKLLWRELGGLSFGEVGTEVITPPTGSATVTEIKKKKSTLVVELRHPDGAKNAVYLDYTAGLDTVSLDEIEAALCRVFVPPGSPPT